MPKSLFRSFAGGEITPELFGRLDLTKFQTGLSLARNFVTLPHGPASRRPGFQFVNETRTSAQASRLIPFVFSADQGVILEFGHLSIRFHTAAGTLLEAVKPIVGVVTGVVEVTGHGYSVGDDVYFTGGAQPRFLRVGSVVDANRFQVADLWGETAIPPSGSTAVARVYQIASPYPSTALAGLRYAQDADVLTISSASYPTQELRRLGAANWTLTAASFAPVLAPPAGVAATAVVAVATNLTTQRYKVTTVAPDLVNESLPSAEVSCSNNLTLAGNYNTISWTAIGSGYRYYVYKLRGGVYGYIGQADTSSPSVVDDNILPDTTVSPPEDNITLNGTAGEYPTAVAHHERRRWFAGTGDGPQNVWATRNGTLSNLTSSVPSRADDALQFRIAAQQQNAIRHLVPLADLLALTAGGEFRIFADGGPAIAPDTLSVKPQGFSGASEVQPVLTTASAIYVQAQGSRVREITYDPSGTGFYRSIDASILATHLFDGHQITQLAYTRAPDSTLWAVRDDGVLLGMTYVPDQQVYGWHQHHTAGAFESIAVIPENNEDTLYAVVRRVVDGRTVRYIERLKPRMFTEQADAFFVDSGLTYSGAPVTTITGLWHLEGKAVQVLADGAVVVGKTVLDGQITLPTAASVVHIGLAYVSDMVTLPLAYEGAPASGQGTMKNVGKVHLRVVRSSVAKAGPNFSNLREYPARLVSDPYGSPPSLQTREVSLSIDPSWNTDGTVCVRQDQPLPLTVAALALDTAVGG